MQTISTTFGQLSFFQAIGTAFGESSFLQAIGATFGQLFFLDAVGRTFGNVVCGGVGTGRGGSRFGRLSVRPDKTEGRKEGNS
ncbi:hypothetical protein D3C85_1400680 [compost metagenome]